VSLPLGDEVSTAIGSAVSEDVPAMLATSLVKVSAMGALASDAVAGDADDAASFPLLPQPATAKASSVAAIDDEDMFMMFLVVVPECVQCLTEPGSGVFR
jgi:hypothetical protein